MQYHTTQTFEASSLGTTLETEVAIFLVVYSIGQLEYKYNLACCCINYDTKDQVVVARVNRQ